MCCSGARHQTRLFRQVDHWPTILPRYAQPRMLVNREKWIHWMETVDLGRTHQRPATTLQNVSSSCRRMPKTPASSQHWQNGFQISRGVNTSRAWCTCRNRLLKCWTLEKEVTCHGRYDRVWSEPGSLWTTCSAVVVKSTHSATNAAWLAVWRSNNNRFNTELTVDDLHKLQAQ